MTEQAEEIEGVWVSPKEFWENPKTPGGYRLVPIEPTNEMIEAGLLSTAGYLDIQGSQLTVNQEKMRIRYRAMLAAAKLPAHGEKADGNG